eukprot:CAMPEP_0184696640 /NCGR_PEP_ID=MMETSP0313-20130426/3872_1 /TAXON_ID=2792 /ORGANISM="Porphyridium aerugineum, Strain SAG 1380-2" /LENGTH=46 /DNA_ID= /DNA_START= /DNA_END= /DNA_ORIENTATION=
MASKPRLSNTSESTNSSSNSVFHIEMDELPLPVGSPPWIKYPFRFL